MATDGLLHYYKAIIRPAVEYACPVWQSSLTVDEHRQLEAVQKRAVFTISGSNDYEFYCSLDFHCRTSRFLKSFLPHAIINY
jgi:hypothetical protein